MRFSKLPSGDRIGLVLTTHQVYVSACKKTERGKNIQSALVFTKGTKIINASTNKTDAEKALQYQNYGVIIILPEMHDSDQTDIQEAAANVADAVLQIPNVKIAVEEPVDVEGVLISNVGWNEGVLAGVKKSTDIFVANPAGRGSIALQIYKKQTGFPSNRYAAETHGLATERYKKKDEINENMVKELINNTGSGQVSVYPVGTDHLSGAYTLNTLAVYLNIASWQYIYQ